MMLATFADEMGFVCRIDLMPAHDCHNGCAFGDPKCRPETGAYHGVGSARWRFAVIKDGYAANFTLGGSYLPETYRRWIREGLGVREPLLGWDIGFHTSRRHCEADSDDAWGTSMAECDLLGGPCWYDGSSLRADQWVVGFLTGKLDIWAALKGEWRASRAYVATAYPVIKE